MTGPGPALPTPEPDLGAEVLPCGRPTEDLVDLVLDGRTPPGRDERDDHQRTCVHCRALAAEAQRLWEPVRTSARALETPPPGLVASVIARVRALGRDPVHLVVPGTRGETRIAADVVRQIAERAAAGVPGVAVALARHARLRPGAGDDAGAALERGGAPERPGSSAALARAVGLAGQHAVIDLAVVTVYGAPIPAVAARVRAAVQAALVAQTTATGVHVDIYVDDVVPR